MGKELRQLTGHDDGVTSATFSADGTHIVTASLDGTTRIWIPRQAKIFSACLTHRAYAVGVLQPGWQDRGYLGRGWHSSHLGCRFRRRIAAVGWPSLRSGGQIWHQLCHLQLDGRTVATSGFDQTARIGMRLPAPSCASSQVTTSSFGQQPKAKMARASSLPAKFRPLASGQLTLTIS